MFTAAQLANTGSVNLVNLSSKATTYTNPSKQSDSLERLNNNTGKLNYLHINKLKTETIPFLTSQHFKEFSQTLYHSLFCFALGYRLYMHTSARYILLLISQPYRPRQQSAPYWLQVTIMSQNQLATRLTGKLINLKLIFSGWELTHRLTNNCIHSLYELQQNSATYPRQVALNYKNERPTLVRMYVRYLSVILR